MSDPAEGVSILIVPEGARESVSFRLSPTRLRVLAVVAVLLLGGAGVVFGSWWYLARKASLVPGLEQRVAELEADRSRVVDLAMALDTLEARYARLQGLVAGNGRSDSSALWLPPPTGRRRSTTGSPGASSDATLPTSWPLADPGFVTQPLLAGEAGEHPGLDIAVPTDTYVRAAGAGRVAEAGEDEVYGRFVVIDHTDGYRTVYAHASSILTAVGQEVRQNEVIALSGSTGRSTAPHLHFEIQRNGEPVDPLSMVRQP